MKRLIIIGAGGFGMEVAAYARDMSGFEIRGFLDDTKPAGQMHAGYRLLGPTTASIDREAFYVVAVGSPEGRRAVVQKFTAAGASFVSIVHPRAYVAPGAVIGEGSVIAPFAFVGPEAHLGKHCVLNVHASAGHESRLGDCCILSPYAIAHGGVELAEGVFLGNGACVTARMKIGANARIAAGAVVYDHVPENMFAHGNPARFRANG
jgi:sugar O-acyltransferase (sialic acid O-acetyltransferase NeuD family)